MQRRRSTLACTSLHAHVACEICLTTLATASYEVSLGDVLTDVLCENAVRAYTHTHAKKADFAEPARTASDHKDYGLTHGERYAWPQNQMV